jgi:hypothetical protein
MTNNTNNTNANVERATKMKNRESIPSLREAINRSKLLSTSAGSHGSSMRHQSSMYKKSDIENS